MVVLAITAALYGSFQEKCFIAQQVSFEDRAFPRIANVVLMTLIPF